VLNPLQPLRRLRHRAARWQPARGKAPLRGQRRRHGDARVEEVLQLARLSFVQFQAAWDRADLQCLAALAAAPLLEELRRQLAERGPGPNHTEVLQLEARLLALDEMQEAFVASVEFSGLIRERPGAAPAPFRELWLLADVKAAGRGWQLAQVQSLS
jgi:predicted lipid-binding transport protein (Tim44 family)